MKYSILWASLAGAMAATAAFAAPNTSGGAISASYSGGGVVGSDSYGLPELNAYRQHRAVAALVREGREMQKTDGGTLTAQHHAYLQAKLNAILAGNY